MRICRGPPLSASGFTLRKSALGIEAFSARHLELLAPSNFSSPYDLPPQQRKNLFFMSAERSDGYIGIGVG